MKTAPFGVAALLIGAVSELGWDFIETLYRYMLVLSLGYGFSSFWNLQFIFEISCESAYKRIFFQNDPCFHHCFWNQLQRSYDACDNEHFGKEIWGFQEKSSVFPSLLE